MRKLLIVLCFLSLLSCSKPHRVHSICVDMGRYVSASDSDSFRMTIEDPINNAVDTIYWHGNKIESEIDEKLHNILAFVEVSKLDSVGAVDRRLFRSVIATDGDMNTISVKEDGSIHLSGSESNENITRLWYGGMADNKIGDLNDYRILNKFLQEEISIFTFYCHLCKISNHRNFFHPTLGIFRSTYCHISILVCSIYCCKYNNYYFSHKRNKKIQF